LPATFALFQNYPNPFNPKTVVRFQVPGISDVKLVVYDILGREVAVLVNERKSAGIYEVSYGASGLASGVYIYRLTAGTYVQSRKMVLLK
jgi:glucuronoarabinoxylan endo-1,4-beta-xylanase